MIKEVNRGNPENPGSEWKSVLIGETVIYCTLIIYLYSENIYELIRLNKLRIPNFFIIVIFNGLGYNSPKLASIPY